jgi:hypothetical protein
MKLGFLAFLGAQPAAPVSVSHRSPHNRPRHQSRAVAARHSSLPLIPEGKMKSQTCLSLFARHSTKAHGQKSADRGYPSRHVSLLLAAGPALAQTENATTTSGGNWTGASTWNCTPTISRCVPNNGTSASARAALLPAPPAGRRGGPGSLCPTGRRGTGPQHYWLRERNG